MTPYGRTWPAARTCAAVFWAAVTWLNIAGAAMCGDSGGERVLGDRRPIADRDPAGRRAGAGGERDGGLTAGDGGGGRGRGRRPGRLQEQGRRPVLQEQNEAGFRQQAVHGRPLLS